MDLHSQHHFTTIKTDAGEGLTVFADRPSDPPTCTLHPFSHHDIVLDEAQVRQLRNGLRDWLETYAEAA